MKNVSPRGVAVKGSKRSSHLLIVRPHAQYLHGVLILENLINEAVVDVDPSRRLLGGFVMTLGLQEVVDGQANIARNPAKKGGRDVAAGMKGDRGRPPIGVAELLVGAALTDLGKAMCFE
jgi:hypothetical protein